MLVQARSADLAEALNQIQGDLCRAAHSGQFTSCAVGLQGGLHSAQAPPIAPPVDPALLARAQKMKTPLSEDTVVRLLQMRVSSFPGPKVDPKKVSVYFGRNPMTRAILEWDEPVPAGAKRNHKYSYTEDFHERNAAEKWKRVQAFRPRMAAIRNDLRKKIKGNEVGSVQHQAATIAGIIAETALRPDRSRGKAATGHFGTSSLRGEHVTVEDGVAHLNFVGKSGQDNKAIVEDPTTVRAIVALKKRAGSGPLFSTSPATAAALLPSGMKLKDMRTIIATETAEKALRAFQMPDPLPDDPEKLKKLIAKAYLAASQAVAKKLNNTPAVAKKSYIHPEVLNSWVREIGGGKLVATT